MIIQNFLKKIARAKIVKVSYHLWFASLAAKCTGLPVAWQLPVSKMSSHLAINLPLVDSPASTKHLEKSKSLSAKYVSKKSRLENLRIPN